MRGIDCMFVKFALVGISIAYDTSSSSSTPPSCQQPALMYFPASGWDILTNADRLPVMTIRYDKCQLTPDGLYKVPDDVIVQPVRESKVQLFSKLIEDLSEYSSVTSKSFSTDMRKNLLGAPSSIVGTYAPTFLKAKQRLIENNASIVRVEVRNVLYRLHLAPTAKLHSDLVVRLEEISFLFQTNNTEKARYLLESLVNDYGTHYSTRIDVGALLLEENDISNVYLNSTSDLRNLIVEAASQSFLKMINFRNDFRTNLPEYVSVIKNYEKNKLASFVESIGGSPLNENMSLDKWLDETAKNPAIIDRGGELILDILREDYLTTLSRKALVTLQKELRIVLKKYYLYNVHSGCTDPLSKNFDYAVNIGDTTCNGTSLPYEFGGMYQRCIPTTHSLWNPCIELSLDSKNPLTGDYSCSYQYNAEVLIEVPSHFHCSRRCTDTNCEESCYGISAAWCSRGKTMPSSEVYFGGIYSDNLVNPVTGQHSCPRGYTALRLGSETFVCASSNAAENLPYSIPFGGFLTDVVGNPLLGKFKKDMVNGTLVNGARSGCLVGYSEHLAVAESTQDPINPLSIVKYCMRSNVLKNLQLQIPLVSPPFISHDALFDAPLFRTTTESPSSDVGLSSGYIIAIIFILLFILIVGFLIYTSVYIYKQRRRNALRDQQFQHENERLVNEPSVDE